MTARRPSGTVTFLLTDLEGSTRMWEQDAEAMKPAMVRHDEILEKTFAANRGFVFSRMGDGMAVAFSAVNHAICRPKRQLRSDGDAPDRGHRRGRPRR
jgi:class 3 adenylate cyclase